MDKASREYVNRRTDIFIRQKRNMGIKLGLLVSSFTAISLALSYLADNVFALVLFAALAMMVTVFGAWTISATVAIESFEFMRELNEEYEEALGR